MTFSSATAHLDAVSLNDEQLAQAIAAMKQAANAQQILDALEEERARRASAARAKRDAIDVLRAVCDDHEADLKAAFEAACEALERAPADEKLAASREAYLAGRQWHSLRHDLFNTTGDKKFQQRWDGVLSRLLMAGGPVAEQYLRSIRSRPPKVECNGWRDDARRLAELLGPRETRIGNGG